MAYYYVKSGGTATGATIDAADGVYSSQQTGTWTAAFPTAAEYFNDLGAAVSAAAGAPSDGDYIIFSDVHSSSYDNGGGIALNAGGAADGAGLILVSVDDDTDITAYSPGASDVMIDPADDITVSMNGFIAGVTLGTGDDIIQVSTTVRPWRFQDLTMKVSGATDNAFKLNQDGAHMILTNVDIDMGNVSSNVLDQVVGGGIFEWNGGTLTGTAPTNLTGNTNFGVFGGATVLFNGVDLSIYAGALGRFGSAAAADHVLWRYENCKLHASATLGTINGPMQRVELYGSDSSVQHRFAIKDWMGQADNDDAVYVTADESWYEGAVISSIKVVTTANCSHVHPFVFELPAQYVDLGAAASDVLSVECVSATSGLQSNDVSAFLVYPDAASTVTPNWVTSGKTVGTGNYGIDPLATTGNALDAGALGAGDWTGEPGTPSFYKLELDTTGDPGEATGASIRIEIYKPSLTIYISPQLRLA